MLGNININQDHRMRGSNSSRSLRQNPSTMNSRAAFLKGAMMGANQAVYIFLCDSNTREEVERSLLVGCESKFWRDNFSNIKVGDIILMYDRSKHSIFGPYRVSELPTQHCGTLKPKAFKGKFPSQARIQHAGPILYRGLEEVLKRCPKLLNRNTPHAKFTGEPCQRLLSLFPITENCDNTSSREMSQIPHKVQESPLQDRRYKTSQGFEVRSKAEYLIAETLSRLGIKCEYEDILPDAPDCKFDFYLPEFDVYIEHWGMPYNPNSRARMEEKQRIYRSLGLRLIDLYPEDEADIESSLRRELRRINIQVGDQTPNWITRALRWLKSLLTIKSSAC